MTTTRLGFTCETAANPLTMMDRGRSAWSSCLLLRPRASRSRAMARYQFLGQQGEERGVRGEVALPETPWFLLHPVQPLQTEPLPEQWRAPDHACDHVERTTHAVVDVRADVAAPLFEEELLARRGDAYEHNIRTCGA